MSDEGKIWVRARAIAKHGFYRCGVFWPAAGGCHELDSAQLARVRGETNLADVEIVDGPEGQPVDPQPEIITTVTRSKPDKEAQADHGDAIDNPLGDPSEDPVSGRRKTRR